MSVKPFWLRSFMTLSLQDLNRHFLQTLRSCDSRRLVASAVLAAVDGRDNSNGGATVAERPVLRALPVKSGLFSDVGRLDSAGPPTRKAGQPTISVTSGWQNLSGRPYFKLYFLA